VIIWGRRRMGKSRLLLEWTQKHKGIYYTADESAASIQRKYFSVALEKALPGFSAVEYPDWVTLFSHLAREAKKARWRGPIVIDELPYLITTSPELPSVLQRFIDHEAKQGKLFLALCGSSQRMMQGAILDPSAPLYGRADEIMKLGPISPLYLKEALKLRNPRRIVETYAIYGGIPRYWELLEKSGTSFLGNIDRLVLDPMGPLHEEPHRLLLEETPAATNLRPILDAIGLGAHRFSEIAGRIGLPVTSLVKPVQRLIELDLIEREIPYGTDEHNSKKALYKIKDPFVRFWFEVVAPRRSIFSQIHASMRIRYLKEGLPSLFAVTWEELCRLAVPLLFKQLGQPFGCAGRFWQGQEGEWDILSQTEDKKYLLVGEAKWTAKPPSPSWICKVIDEIKSRGVPPVQRSKDAEVIYAVFLPEKPLHLKLPKDVKVIDARAVVQVLI